MKNPKSPPGGSICIFFPAGSVRFGSPSRCGHHSASRSPSSRSEFKVHFGRLLQSSKMHFELCLLGKALSNCGIEWNRSIIQTCSNHHHLCHNWRAGESEKFLSDEVRCHGQPMPCKIAQAASCKCEKKVTIKSLRKGRSNTDSLESCWPTLFGRADSLWPLCHIDYKETTFATFCPSQHLAVPGSLRLTSLRILHHRLWASQEVESTQQHLATGNRQKKSNLCIRSLWLSSRLFAAACLGRPNLLHPEQYCP